MEPGDDLDAMYDMVGAGMNSQNEPRIDPGMEEFILSNPESSLVGMIQEYRSQNSMNPRVKGSGARTLLYHIANTPIPDEYCLKAMKLVIEEEKDLVNELIIPLTYNDEEEDEIDGKEGQSALFAAAARGKIECVRFLLKHGANPNGIDDSMLMHKSGAVLSALEGKSKCALEIARLLVVAGAELEMAANKGLGMFSALGESALNVKDLVSVQKLQVGCWECLKSSKEAGQNLRKCTGCGVARYCSKECQQKNWSVHKKDCKYSKKKLNKANV
mmetsp:Transcript_15857/g.25898  ORF Transcript_15857/g.25898 Transcript_15857/m.25898 type:complete len:273 (+) Transcript_15857:246-1064(+)|eukprot:CAMPEP_0203766516 /NCGR_PEP_ID=MMETSP0099_2-20121227/467_1 /ASSEMBLY_ACC=CAM_ASM_000209 /TAXON_ID=96639 /ORGANISM=" , Strain NY0313808BC1" /LENGTH=272 /DNA_ID=CAMNT_0050662887 /DNA_START=160 /DNA_END=978 /DNA_ORIENTATION=-